MTLPLTKKQYLILSFIRSFIEREGFAPSFREIADQFHLSSLATVHQHLQVLKTKGFIDYTAGSSRSLLLIDPVEDEQPGAIYELPLLGLITAGQPIEAIEEKEMIRIPEILIPRPHVGKRFALRVKGDSMIEDGIFDGDIVIVNQQQTANNGDIVVALLENEFATLKRFYRESSGIRLQPANKNYKPIRVKNVQVQGKVIGLVRKF